MESTRPDRPIAQQVSAFNRHYFLSVSTKTIDVSKSIKNRKEAIQHPSFLSADFLLATIFSYLSAFHFKAAPVFYSATCQLRYSLTCDASQPGTGYPTCHAFLPVCCSPQRSGRSDGCRVGQSGEICMQRLPGGHLPNLRHAAESHLLSI